MKRKNGKVTADDIIDALLTPEFGRKLLKRAVAMLNDKCNSTLDLKETSEDLLKGTTAKRSKSPKWNENGYGITVYADSVLKGCKPSIGRNTFFRLLRRDKYLGAPGSSKYNLPLKKSLDNGLMSIETRPWYNAKLGATESQCAHITKKGAEFFYNKYVLNHDTK